MDFWIINYFLNKNEVFIYYLGDSNLELLVFFLFFKKLVFVDFNNWICMFFDMFSFDVVFYFMLGLICLLRLNSCWLIFRVDDWCLGLSIYFDL